MNRQGKMIFIFLLNFLLVLPLFTEAQIQSIEGEKKGLSKKYTFEHQPRKLLRNGVKYASKGEFEKAEQEFENALKSQNLKYLDKFVCRKFINTLKNLDKKTINEESIILLFKGEKVFALNQPHKAIEYYQKAIQIDPNDEGIYYGLGIAYRILNKYLKSIKNYQKAIHIEPDYIPAYIGIGTTYLYSNQPHKAIEYYQTAIQINPKEKDAYFGLGIAYNYSNQPYKARQNLLKARELFLQAGNHKMVGTIDQRLEELSRQSKIINITT